MKALKKTELQPIHQGRPLFNRTLVRPGQVLPQLPELQSSGLQIFFSYSLQGPCWSLVDLVLSFHYSPYHSCTHLLQLPPLWTTNFCLLSLQTLMEHKLWQSHCKTQAIPKNISLFSNLSPVGSNTFAGCPFHSCAIVLQPLPTEEIRRLRKPSLPVRLRFRLRGRLDVPSYCFMQNT